MPDATRDVPPRRTSLAELASLFLKLGTIAFGGPAAHVAMMEDEVVRRRRWMSREQFLDYYGATNLIPGPNSTELAIHIGHARAGWPGLLIAGTCFIVPAALIVTAIASAYVRYGSLPQAEGLLYGVKPVVIAVVLQALLGLARSAVTSGTLAALAVIAAMAAALGVNELLMLVAAGALAATLSRLAAAGSREALHSLGGAVASLSTNSIALRRSSSVSGMFAPLGVAIGAAPFGLWPLFLLFLKVGSVLFGSGYVLLAFLRADLVERLGWLSEQQLLDAVAVGQMTPGPVFTTATFIGYVLGGATGALVATIGIFLPAFVFVALSGPLVPRIRGSPTARAVLDGVNVASLALMAVVTWHLGHSALVDVPTVTLAVLSLLLLVRFRVNSAWLVAGGGIVGLLLPR